MLASAQHRWLVLACGVLLGACSSFNADLLKRHAEQRSGKAGAGSQNGDAAIPGNDGGDAAMPAMAGKGTGGTGGNPASTGGGGSGQVAGDCMPNPSSLDGTCLMICPETCNGEDDDCDGTIDEDLESACKLDNATAACARGKCLIAQCQKGFRDCDHDPATGCEVAPDDVNNCGGCGIRCALSHAIAACVADRCAAIGCQSPFVDCDTNPDDCETAANTLQNCMGCGVACTDSQVPNAIASCEQGVCGVGQCFSSYGDCNQLPTDGCEQMLATTDHCGACGQACNFVGSIDDCSTGTCLAQSCEPGYDDCDGNLADGCESLDTSVRCGACNKVCDNSLANVTSASCDNQQCTPVCAPGFGDCDADASTGCEAPVTTLSRCGDCNTACARPNAVMSCDTGTCVFVRCDPGYGDCNGSSTDPMLDGCETSLNADTTCGACNINCTTTTKPVCSGGSCTNVTCPDPNTADCNQNGLPCEVNIKTDVNHCGSCSLACAFTSGTTPHAGAGLTCNAGRCQPACDAQWADCNKDYRDGCETSLTTLGNCGQCGTTCVIPNATATCASASCNVSQCAADWADCNMDGKSCETQLGTTLNCTGCGQDCSLPNAINDCAGSAGSHSCAVAGCVQSYYQDCDSMPGNGCEIDTNNDAKHCGQCSTDCTKDPHVASATCGTGVCGYTCATNFGNCSSSMPGCETPLTTNTNCKACGVSCARTNGTADCSTGTCTLSGCNAGFGNCDSNPDNGCEPLTTLTNCGACGTPCAIVNGTGECSTQSCKVASCNSGWADCDQSPTNGCERNINTPANGGQGPCLPDTMGCTHQTYGGQDYYFCTTVRTWSDARTHCQQQLLGDLVHINDMAEDTFVHSNIGGDTWIGATDSATEGTWLWVNDNTQFWMGTSSGSAVGGRYTHWNTNEPSNSNNEDCGEMYAAGQWNDQPCGDTRAFVCEVLLDLCPNDPNKINPGQCGCGNLDTDTDTDGTADCNDGCPSDKNKQVPGVCGCGVAEVDTDLDGVLDCKDGCPTDMSKTAPGVCGCGTADTDSDGDGVPNCHDGCPQDPARTAAPCAFDYTPVNFDPNALNFSAAPSTNLNCQSTTTIDTTAPVTITNWCGTAPTPVVVSQSGGPDVVILPLQGLTIASSTTLRVIGNRPLILAVGGDVVVSGTINARATGTTPGAGGNVSCSGGKGGNGATASNGGQGGGGGAGLGAVGATGGRGRVNWGSTSNGGAAGAVEGSATIVPLRGGCVGGNGGHAGGSTPGGLGGSGGGAVQISASLTISVGATGIISTSGGGGRSGSSGDGGGGGGSGGAVILEAHVVTVSSGAWVTANGGGGASGSNAGADGSLNSSSQAAGGNGGNGEGDGGKGGSAGNASAGGGNGGTTNIISGSGGGGGGGGGGVGRIRVHGTVSCSLSSGVFSPASGQTNCP